MEKDRRENFLRKLHSLSGVLPLGVFLTFHMLMNSSVLRGPEAYDFACYFMTTLLPFKDLLEWGMIYIPLMFHMVLGVWIALKAKNNVGTYKYGRNWGFWFQRLSGLFLVAFLIWHIWTTRVQVALGVEPTFETMAALVANPLFLVFYILGITSAIFHLANGLWTFLITWGITVSERSQKISRFVCYAFFVAFSIFGIVVICTFAL